MYVCVWLCDCPLITSKMASVQFKIKTKQSTTSRSCEWAGDENGIGLTGEIKILINIVCVCRAKNNEHADGCFRLKCKSKTKQKNIGKISGWTIHQSKQANINNELYFVHIRFSCCANVSMLALILIYLIQYLQNAFNGNEKKFTKRKWK